LNTTYPLFGLSEPDAGRVLSSNRRRPEPKDPVRLYPSFRRNMLDLEKQSPATEASALASSSLRSAARFVTARPGYPARNRHASTLRNTSESAPAHAPGSRHRPK